MYIERCPVCGAEVCQSCKGRGREYLPLASGNGTGTYTDNLCPECDGTGWVKMPLPEPRIRQKDYPD